MSVTKSTNEERNRMKNFSFLRNMLAMACLNLVLAAVVGCRSIGPSTIKRDRIIAELGKVGEEQEVY